jgi:hypothetical protein
VVGLSRSGVVARTLLAANSRFGPMPHWPQVTCRCIPSAGVFGLQWALDSSISCHSVGGLVQTTGRRKMAGLDAVTGSGWEGFACSRYNLAVARDSWMRDKHDVLPHPFYVPKYNQSTSPGS